MVDPGIVLDALAAEASNGSKLGYLSPEENPAVTVKSLKRN
jgi:hypothetical protein